MSDSEKRFREFIGGLALDDTPDPAHRNKLQEELFGVLSRQRSRKANPWNTAAYAMRKGMHFMRNSYVKYPAAATLLAAVAIIWLWNGSSAKAYAMPDVPALVRNAKTVHIQAWYCVPTVAEAGQERVKVRTEGWFDLASGRFRKLVPTVDRDAGRLRVRRREIVCDGWLVMTVDHAGKWVSYEKLTPLQCRLEARGGVEQFLRRIGQAFGPGQGDFCAKTGQETIGGKRFDVYAGEVHSGQAGVKFRTWFSPTTGDVGRWKVWIKQKGQNWSEYMGIETLERDVPPPRGAFKLAPPAGYTLRNTPGTAAPRKLTRMGYRIGELALAVHLSFVMPDGSVIVCWDSVDKAAAPAGAKLFRSLKPGGPLPDLPIVLYGLRSISTGKLLDYIAHNMAATRKADAPAEYVGRHLAATRKGGEIYEWGLYVPKEKPLPRDSIYAYRCLLRYTPPDRKVPGWIHAAVDFALPIGPKDFGAFVRGAMAELSDGGAAPEHVTYESVSKLARDIRRGMEKK